MDSIRKIIILMGKSACGKDTIASFLLKDSTLCLKRIVSYTTRPMRSGEKNGREYFFISDLQYDELQATGKIIETRSYRTIQGIWKYCTVNDAQFMDENNCLLVGTLEMYSNLQQYFGQENILPIMIDIDDGERLQRALNREKAQVHANYSEMCRRFLADSEDYSLENLVKAGITRIFENVNLEKCLLEIKNYILSVTK